METGQVNLNYFTHRCDWIFSFSNNPYYWQLYEKLGCICRDKEYRFDVPPPSKVNRSLIAAQTIGKQRLADNGYKRAIARRYMYKHYDQLPQDCL